jgi:hypothetical protein
LQKLSTRYHTKDYCTKWNTLAYQNKSYYSSFEIFLELETIALWFDLSIDHTVICKMSDTAMFDVFRLCFIRRNLKVQSQTIKERAYQTLIRPKLEYCCTVWDPHTNENINSLEKVQQRAARYTCKRHNTSSVSEMWNTMNWQTLQERRLRTRFRSVVLFLSRFLLLNWLLLMQIWFRHIHNRF